MRTWLSALAVPLLLIACAPTSQPPDDDDGPGGEAEPSFSDANAAVRQAAIETAIGMNAVYAALALFQAEQDAFADMGCPSMSVVGDDPMVLRYEAEDCLGPSGARYDGVAEAMNFSAFLASDGPMRFSFERFSFDLDGSRMMFEGSYEQSETTFEVDYSIASTLALEVDGDDRTTEYEQDCAWTEAGIQCTFAEGAKASVDGVRGFGIEGSYDLIAQGGSLSLSATDTLLVDFDEANAEHCAPFTIDGEAAGEFCYEPGVRPEPEPEPVGGIESSGWGCIGGENPLYLLDAFTFGDVASTRVRIATPTALVTEEEHVLVEDVQTEDLWKLQLLAGGSYEAQVATQLSCEATNVSLVFQALDTAGGVLACQVGGDATGVDTSDCP